MATPSSRVAVAAPSFDVVAPFLFVLFWSTGFVGAKLGLPYAEPFTFLLVRFLLAGLLLVVLVQLLRVGWPTHPRMFLHSAVVGLLLQTLYLGGVFNAIHLGMAAGLAALITGLQPLVTAILGQLLLRERVAPRQWLGLVMGLSGVGLVVGEPLLVAGGSRAAPSLLALASVSLALFAGTGGTLYQRRFGRDLPLLSSTAIQFGVASVVMLLAALLLETMVIRWTAPFVFALGWLVLVLSIGAVLLLMLLLRRNAAARVASLFYLVPPATALEAFVIFDERLGLLALGGMLVVVLGVALVLMPARGAAVAATAATVPE